MMFLLEKDDMLSVLSYLLLIFVQNYPRLGCFTGAHVHQMSVHILASSVTLKIVTRGLW
jgi:hypothetical protein